MRTHRMKYASCNAYDGVFYGVCVGVGAYGIFYGGDVCNQHFDNVLFQEYNSHHLQHIHLGM